MFRGCHSRDRRAILLRRRSKCRRSHVDQASLGVYSGKLQVPYEAFAAGLGDHRIVTTLCPGGKERMRRLIEMILAKRLPFRELVTHSYDLAKIEEAYELFAHQRDGVMKVAIRP